MPRWLRVPGGGPDRGSGLDIAFAANYLCIQMLATRNVFMYTDASYRAAAIAKQTRKPEHIAVAHSKFALNWGLFGMHRLGRIYGRAALRAVESRPRDVTWARTMAHLGSTHYTAGRLDEGEANLRESVATLDKVIDYYATFSHHFLRHIYSVRGEPRGALAEAEAEITQGKARGDSEALGWGLYGKADALAREGKTSEALELALMAVETLHSRGSLAEAAAYQVLGFVRLQASDYAGARAALVKSGRMIRENYFLMEFVAPTYPLLVESLLGPRWADAEGGLGRAEARKAWRESQVARFIGWLFPNYGSHALRVSGRSASALGKTKNAARYFERAITAAEKHGARYELARALLDASRVIPEKAADYRRRGQQLLDELGAVVPEAERRGA